MARIVRLPARSSPAGAPSTTAVSGTETITTAFRSSRSPAPSPRSPAPGHARSVTDVREAAAQARRAAGDRDVLVHGAEAARALLQAGELDEMSLQIIPVLLGRGRRLFDDMPAEQVELELVRALDGPNMLHTRYRVRSPDERRGRV